MRPHTTSLDQLQGVSGSRGAPPDYRIAVARESHLPRLREVVNELSGGSEYRDAKIHVLLTDLVRRGEKVRVIYTTGHWLDVDSLDDVLAAGAFR